MSFFCLSGVILFIAIFLSLIFNKQIWITTEISLLLMGLILLCGTGFLYFAKNIWSFASNRKYFWFLCFFTYLLFLSYLLFFSKDFARDRVDILQFENYFDYLSMQWQYAVNLKPFKSIMDMISVLNTSLADYSIVNLLGNLVAFIPFAFFLKILNTHIRFSHFFFIISVIVILVEITQFFTLTGSMDIDDYILNVFGASLFYGFLNIPIISRLMLRFH